MKYAIGKRIQTFRKKRKFSQKQLAERLGISSSLVSNWEQGINRPGADIIAALCAVLEVSPSELLDVRLTEDEFTSQEREVIRAYRSKPELQHAVNVLLGIEKDISK